MTVVRKYEIPPVSWAKDFLLQRGAQVLSFQAQGQRFFFWAALDPGLPADELRSFEAFETGWLFDRPGAKYVGTAQGLNLDGRTPYVLHLFETTKKG